MARHAPDDVTGDARRRIARKTQRRGCQRRERRTFGDIRHHLGMHSMQSRTGRQFTILPALRQYGISSEGASKMSLLFNPDAVKDVDRTTMATARHGERVDTIGRYKMPLLPGESGPKSGGDWVPGGLQSATNLAGAIVESRELGIWERER